MLALPKSLSLHIVMRVAVVALPVGLLLCTAYARVQECAHESCDLSEAAQENPDHASLLQTSYLHQPRRVAIVQAQSLPNISQPVSREEQKRVGIYPWSSRGGNPQTSTSTNATAPTNFSKKPSELWNNSMDEELRHSPLIDDEKNIYIVTTTHIRKFDSDGKVLWVFSLPEADGSMVTSPALYDGALFAMSQGPLKLPVAQTNVTEASKNDVEHKLEKLKVINTFSIDMQTGKQLWKKTYARYRTDDSSATLAYNNTILFPIVHNPTSKGSDSLMALNTSDGNLLWEYETDDVFWNFKPSSPGDGSIIFSSSCGAVHRIDFDGKLIWKKAAITKPSPGGFCSMGGGAVGPNGVFYTEHGSNIGGLPGHSAMSANAHINAYRITDGKHLWSKTFGEFGGQYPAVGYLGKDGPLAVMAPIGSSFSAMGPGGKPLGTNKSNWLVNAVVAMDAETGDVLWRWDEKPWPWGAAAGDFGEPMKRRIEEKKRHPRRETICLPDPQGIPLISGDGHVYVSSAHTGDLVAMKDANGDGKISGAEESTFSSKVGFLNSPALAQGMLVAAPCWGPVYIFKEESKL